METIFCKIQSNNFAHCLLLMNRLKKNLWSFFLTISFIFSGFTGISQTTSLSFTQIPVTDPEFIGPGRGAENWNGLHMVSLPASGSSDGSMDYYYRFSWTDIQDYNTGAYTYTILDSRVHAAIDRGSRFNFGVMAFYPGTGPSVGGSTLNYPLPVHNAMQAEPVYKDARDVSSGYPGYNSWVPNWNAPSFRSAYNAMMDAVIAHLKNTTYNGIKEWDAVGYVDIRTYGNTGEWTGYNPATNPSYMPSNTIATAATMIQFIDDFVARVPDKQLFICTASITGTSTTDGVYPEVGYKVFTTSNQVGRIGLRRDCLGETDAWIHTWFENNPTVYNGLVFKDQIMNFYKYAPWGGEPCSCCTIGGGSVQYWDLPRQVTYYHNTFFGNGNLENSGSSQVQDNIRAASKAAGYRLILTGGSMPTTLPSGGTFNLTLNWQNIGATPTYENWNVVYELRNSSGTAVWTGNSAFKLKLFIPQSSATATSDNFTLSAIANGTYSLYMIVKDPTGYRKPLPLGITGRNADGSYLLRSNITIGPGTANQPPVANAGADKTITLPTSTISLTGTGTDADGSVASYAWTKLSGPTGGTISSASVANTNITGLIQGVYVFKLTVTDNLGATGSANVQVTVNSAASNQPPVANAGADKSVTLPTSTISLTGTGTDPDGSIAGYAWTKLSGPSGGTISSPSAANTNITGLIQGVYVFKLTVTDNQGATGVANIQVTVNPVVVNQPPLAKAGADQTITLPTSSVTLNGSSSSDPDGSIKSYLWALISGPSQYTISNTSSALTTATNLTAGIYSFQLKVTDNGGSIALDTIKVIVNAAPANQIPIANAGGDITITLPTNLANLDGSSSVDPDGTISTYNWNQVSGPSAATIGTAKTAATSVSSLKQGVYVFALSITDNKGASDADSVTVTVNALPNIPPTANAGSNKSVILPVNSTSLDASLSIDSDGSISSYSWAQISGPSTATLTGKNLSVATASNLVAGTYTFEITVTDNSGSSSKARVKISVVASGIQPPVANAGANQTITLPVNSVTLDGSGSSASSGSIVSYVWTQKSGPTTVSLSKTAKNTLSGLQAGTYIFSLTVTDNSAAKGTDSVIITVNQAANIVPVADAGSSISITLPTNTAILDGSNSYDPDGTISSYAWTKISGPNTPVMKGGNTATLNLSGLIAGQYSYSLKVTDNSGASSTVQVKIIVATLPNVSPIADAGVNQSITLPVNSANLDGSASADPDGNITKYSWVKVSGPGTITISNSNTANPSVAGLQVGVYIFELTVTDNSGATAKDQTSVFVNPKPVQPNQIPVANAGSNKTITTPANSVTLSGAGSADPDGTISGYSWRQISGPTNAVISGGSTITATVTQLELGQYVFELIVTDNNGAKGSDQVTITVNQGYSKTNVPPVANAGANDSITVQNSSYTLNAGQSVDPDGSIVTYQWNQIGGPNTVVSSTMNNPQVTISDLQVGDYIFQVTVTDNSGATSTALMNLKVGDAPLLDQLTLYPNPAHSVINERISSTITGKVMINIYDMNGRLVLATQTQKTGDIATNTTIIDVLAPGMYTMQINIANRKTIVKKFIKN